MRKAFLLFVIALFMVSGSYAMQLAESIDYALKNNPTVIASQKKAAAAEAKRSQAVSAFFPSVNLDGNLNRVYSQPATMQMTTQGVTQTLSIGTDNAADVKGLQASLSQPVFVAALFPGYDIAKKGADTAKENYRQTVIDTSFRVTEAYFSVQEAQKMEQLMKESLDMARSHREQVQSMLNAGMATRADLLRSKVREANAQVALIKARYNVDLAKDAFNNTLGRDMKQLVDLKEEALSGKVAVIREYDALLSAAYANRPDWKMYLLATGISQNQLDLSRSEYLPTVVLNANAGNQLTEYPTFNSSVNSWKVMGMGSWKLFDSFGREGRVREAAENLSAQQASVDQVKNNVALEVRDAYFTLNSALDTVVATKSAVDSAQESYTVATSRYNSGVGTNTDVLDSQVDWTQAETNYFQSLFDVEVAKARINKVVGKKVYDIL
jgi:outer membrane protein TolC